MDNIFDNSCVLPVNEIPLYLAMDACYKAAERGDCENYEIHWYFDTKVGRCLRFYYGGCGGKFPNDE